MEIVQSAPDDIDWDEVLERVFLKARASEANAAKAEGRVFTTEEMLAKAFPCTF